MCVKLLTNNFLLEKAIGKSKDVHLAVLRVLPEVIRESVDADASSKSVIIYDPATGEKKMVSPTAVDGIESLGEVKTAEQREAEINSQMQDAIQRSKDWLEGNVTDPVGMQIQLGDGRIATIEAMHEDGKSAIATLPDGTQFLVSKDVLQRIVNNGHYADYKARRDAEASRRDAEQSTESAPETATGGGQPLPEEVASKEEERREYAQGDEFEVIVDGQKMHAEIVSPKDADGRFVVNVDDGESMRTLYVTPEELAAMEYKEPKEEPLTESENPRTIDTEEPPISNAAPTEHTPTALERIPRDEKGNAQFHDVDTETAWDGLVEMSGNEETARKVAEASLANAEKKLKAAKALKEKGETPEELLRSIKENEKAVAEAEREVDAWKAIVGEKARREEATKAEAERIATEKAEAERKAAEERERAEAEEKTRIEAEKKEAERIAAEKAEEEARVEDEKKAEEERKTKEGENTLKAKIEAASADVNTEPTEAQKEAGNYKKGHVQVGTFDITIEQPEGSIRRGTDADGKKWESKMHNTYGYFRGTEGVDGDHIDVFLSNDIDGWNGRKVFVVDQYNPDGTFDEHKVMLGFNDMDEAKSDYLANYEKGWENGRRITVSTTNLEDFEKWIDSSHRKTKPFSEYSSVNKGSEKAEKKQEKPSVFDKAKEIADKEEKKRKAEADKPKQKPLTEAERKDAEEVAGALGYRVEWVDTMEENGTIDADKKVIRIAKDAENPLVQVLGHEVAHGVKRMDGGKFKALQKAAMEVVGEKEWNERIEKKRKLNAYAEGKLAEEVTCDIVGEALNDKDALKRLAESLRGEKGILARLRDAVARMVEYFKNRGDKEGVRRMKAADKLLAEFESALKEGVAPEQVKPEGVDRSEREGKKDDKTLYGVHNISEDKLRKAMKLGGLANPSMAVVDKDKGTHEGFGAISLIAPSSLVDKQTGHTAGTWITDAYSQRYPSVERVMSDKGYEKFKSWVDGLDFAEKEKKEIKRQATDAMGNDKDLAWELMYLREKGVDVKGYTSEVDYPWEKIIEEYPSVEDIIKAMDHNAELKETVTKLAKVEITGPVYRAVSADVRRRFKEETGENASPLNPIIRKRTYDIYNRDYAPKLLDENGMPKASDVRKVIGQMVEKYNATKKVDFNKSKSKASTYVHDNGLYADYLKWQEGKLEEFGTQGRIFRGYKNDGTRKYVPETLSNVSKAMKEESQGQTNGSEYTSFGSFIAKLAPRVDSKEEMRGSKSRLDADEAKQEFYEKWESTYYDLATELHSDVFSGEARLHDIVLQSDPKRYAKKEYGITLSPSFLKRLEALKKAIREDLKSAYFETKFERPVMLNEFAAAVVPKGIGDDVRKGLEDAGLVLYEYDPAKKGDRERAANEASASDGIRFNRSEKTELTAEERELRDNLVERMRKGGLDVVTDSEEMQRVIDTENERTRESRKRRSAVAEERLRVGNTIDEAMAAATHLTKEEARAMRREWERKFKEETKELYGRVLSGNFDDVTLRLIDEFIDKSTPNNPYGRPLSKRLPPRVGQKMRGGERTGSIDALFSRISESAVGKDGKALPRAERERAIEEKKKELLKKWAIATGNWHTDIADFTDQREPIGSGTDSDVYLGKDGKSVIKVSKGKPYGKRFRPDVDNVALFNSVFRNSAYTIVGYGEVDGKFVRFLKQPIVDFTDSTPLTEGERVAYMEKLGFKPINKENTAFSNGEIIASDLQKSNIVKDKQGNVRVIDADMKLHTKDVGGNYSYPDVEADTRTDQRFLRTAGGDVYGLVKDGRIYLDPKVATAETAVHEYTHLWGDMLRRKDSEQWNHTVKELKNSVLWEEVKELYPELKTDDEIADEVLSTFSGRRGAERLREEARRVADGDGGVFTKAKAIETLERVKEAIARFWEGVARMFGINRYRSAEELADMAMKDLLDSKNPMKDESGMRKRGEVGETLATSGTYFSGGGLLEAGLKGVIDPKVAVEFSEKIAGVYADNHGNHIVVADVRDVDPKKLVGAVDGGEVQYFHASPVCKNFSKAKREGGEVELDKETALSTAEFIAKTRPKVVTIENVKGYRNSEALKIITDELTRQGYDWDADVYNAADYGGYTKRERLIVRAKRDGKLPPKPEKLPEELRKKGWYSAVEDLIPHLEEKKTGVPQGTDERLKNSGIDYRTIDKPLYVFGRGYANKTVGHAFADELLPTLTTGGGDIIIMPDGRVLKASPRVLARVTGLPDTYKMPETDQLSHTIVGNGIPTQLTEGVIAPLLDNAIPSAERATKRESVFDVADRVSQNLEERTRAMAERIAEQPVEEINNRFNEELEKYQNNELPKGHRFELGMPSAELQSAGFPTLPISMRSSLLAKKAGAERHPFAPTDLRDLVNAIQKPIAIFNYSKNNMRNLIVDVSRGGKHFLVGVTLNYKADNIEINSVSGLFPKENHEWIKWIQDGKVLRIDQKEKVQDLINSLRTNPAESERIGLNLDDVAKKVKDFENPKLFGEEIIDDGKKGSDSTDRSVRENPKNEDKPRYSRKPGESIFDYASRVSEDVDRSVREIVSARDEYEKKVKSKGFQTKEALQNSMLGLQEFMFAIDHASGNKRYIEDIPDFENPILGENRLSSVNKEEMHQVAKTQFKPLMSAVAKLSGNGKESGELYDYMFAKHGLERDAVMRQREAQKEFDKYQKANPKGTKTIGDFVASLEGKDYAGLTALTAEDGRVKSIQSQIDAIDEQMKATDDQLLLRYLGGQKKRLKVDLLNAARDAADDIRKAFESNPSHDWTDINELWTRVNEVNGNTLRKLYESGMLTKEAYNDISSMYTNYIPMRGFDQTTSADAYAYLTHGDSAFNAPIKTAKGRSSKADNPIAYMQAMAESAIMQGNRNVLVKQKMLNFVRNHPSDLASVSDVWLQYDSVADEWKPFYAFGRESKG